MIYIVEYFQPALNEWVFIHLFFDRDFDFVKDRVLALRDSGFNYPLRIVNFSRVTVFSLKEGDFY